MAWGWHQCNRGWAAVLFLVAALRRAYGGQFSLGPTGVHPTLWRVKNRVTAMAESLPVGPERFILLRRDRRAGPAVWRRVERAGE